MYVKEATSFSKRKLKLPIFLLTLTCNVRIKFNKILPLLENCSSKLLSKPAKIKIK